MTQRSEIKARPKRVYWVKVVANFACMPFNKQHNRVAEIKPDPLHLGYKNISLYEGGKPPRLIFFAHIKRTTADCRQIAEEWVKKGSPELTKKQKL